MKFYYANLYAQEQKRLGLASLKSQAKTCRDSAFYDYRDNASIIGHISKSATPASKEGIIQISSTIMDTNDWWTMMRPVIIDKGLKTCVDFVVLNFDFRKYTRSLSIEWLGFKDRLVLRLAVETYINLTLNASDIRRGILREIFYDGDMFFCATEEGAGDAQKQFNELGSEITKRKGFVYIPFAPDDEKTKDIDIDFQAMVFLDWVYRTKVRGRLIKEAREFIGNGYFSLYPNNIERIAHYSKMNVEDVAVKLAYLRKLWDDINTKKLTGPAFLARVRMEMATTKKDPVENTYTWIINKLKSFIKMSNKEHLERMEEAKLYLTAKG